jgi:hypothetical protein
MNFLDVLNPTLEFLVGNYQSELDSFRTSLQSDPLMRLSFSGEFLKNSKNALACLAAIPLLVPSTRNYFLIQDVRKHIGKMAENFNFQGGWSIVGEILQTTTSMTVRDSWLIILKNVSLHDWFGNFVPKLVSALKSAQSKKIYSSVISNTHPVKTPQRGRGYRDKGTKRPSHLWLPSEYPELERRHFQNFQIMEPAPIFWFWLYLRGSGL